MAASERIRGVRGIALVVAIGAAIGCGGSGCSSAYDAALRDMALSGDARLGVRVDEMVRCAEHAVRSLGEAAEWYGSHADRASSSSDVHFTVLLCDAEAGVFEFSRRVLSVEDVSGGVDPERTGAVAHLHASMGQSERSMGAALAALKGLASGDPGASIEVVMRAVNAARADAEALRREARAIRSSAGTPS